MINSFIFLGPLAQSVASPIADPGVAISSRPGPTPILLYADSRRAVVSYKRKYVHKVLVNRFVKLAQEKQWSGGLTIST